MTESELIKALSGDLPTGWTFAKTMAEHPHEWQFKGKWNNKKLFEDIVIAIREYGVAEKFYNATYIYFYCNGYKHWTMGAPISETIIINRAKV